MYQFGAVKKKTCLKKFGESIGESEAEAKAVVVVVVVIVVLL